MADFQLETADLLIVLAYCVFIVALGIYFAKRTRTTDDYFLAGRSLAWWLIGFSLLASNVSSSTFIGLSSAAYSSGIAVYNYEWMAAVVLIIYLTFFLPFYLRTRVFTLPEFLEKRFDQRSRYYFSALQVLMNIAIDTAAALYAGALVIQMVYPEAPLWLGSVAIGMLAGLYTIAGGLKAVVYTDAVQAVLLLIGGCVVAVLAFDAIGFSWDNVTAAVPAEALSIVRPAADPTLPWPGLVSGVFLLGFYFWSTNQFMVQRTLAARDLHHGRWGALFGGALKLPLIFIVVLPGIFGRILYDPAEFPALAENPDLIFPTMMFDLLPVGLRGLVMAALLAAIMSSIDSILNAASTLVTMDFVRKLKPSASNAALVIIGRIATFVFMCLAILWAPRIVEFPNIWVYLQQMLSFVSPPVVACFVGGLFWKRANAHGALAALVVGHLSAAGIFVLAVKDTIILQSGPLGPAEAELAAAGTPVIHFLYVAPVVLVFSFAALLAASLATPRPPDAVIDDLTWSRAAFRAETKALEKVSWYRNYRYLSAALLLVTTALVIAWW